MPQSQFSSFHFPLRHLLELPARSYKRNGMNHHATKTAYTLRHAPSPSTFPLHPSRYIPFRFEKHHLLKAAYLPLLSVPFFSQLYILS